MKLGKYSPCDGPARRSIITGDRSLQEYRVFHQRRRVSDRCISDACTHCSLAWLMDCEGMRKRQVVGSLCRRRLPGVALKKSRPKLAGTKDRWWSRSLEEGKQIFLSKFLFQLPFVMSLVVPLDQPAERLGRAVRSSEGLLQSSSLFIIIACCSSQAQDEGLAPQRQSTSWLRLLIGLCPLTSFKHAFWPLNGDFRTSPLCDKKQNTSDKD
jgi:hypothetical protein